MPPVSQPTKSHKILSSAAIASAANSDNPILPVDDIEEAVWTYVQTTRTPKTKLDFAAQKIGAFKPLSSWKRRVLRLSVKDGSCTMIIAEDEDSLKASVNYELARVVDLKWVFIPEDESLAFGAIATHEHEIAAGAVGGFFRGGGGADDDGDDFSGFGSSTFRGGMSTAIPSYQYVYGQIAFSVLILNAKYFRQFDACGDNKEKMDALLARPEVCTVVSFAFGSTAEAESWYDWFTEFILLRERALVETKDSDTYGSFSFMSGGGVGGGGHITGPPPSAGGGDASSVSDGGNDPDGSPGSSHGADHPHHHSKHHNHHRYLHYGGALGAAPTYQLTPQNVRALKEYVHFFLKSGPKGVGGGGLGGASAAARLLWGTNGPPNGGRLRCKAPNSSDYQSIFLNGNYQTAELFFAKSNKSAVMRLINGGVKYTRRLILNSNCRIMGTSAFGTEFVVDMTPPVNYLVYPTETGERDRIGGGGGDADEIQREHQQRRGGVGGAMWSHGAGEGGGDDNGPSSSFLPPLAANIALQYRQQLSTIGIGEEGGGGGSGGGGDMDDGTRTEYDDGRSTSGGGAGRRTSYASTAIINTGSNANSSYHGLGGVSGAAANRNQPQLHFSKNTWSFLCKSVKIRNAFIEWLRLIKGKGVKAQSEEETYPFTISARDDLEDAYALAAMAAAGISTANGGGGRSSSPAFDRRVSFGGSNAFDDGTATNYSYGGDRSNDGRNSEHTYDGGDYGAENNQNGGGPSSSPNNSKKKVGFNEKVTATDVEEERRRREEEEYLALYPSREPSSRGSSVDSVGSCGRPFRYFPTFEEVTVLPYIDECAAIHLIGRPIGVLKRVFPPGRIPPSFLQGIGAAGSVSAQQQQQSVGGMRGGSPLWGGRGGGGGVGGGGSAAGGTPLTRNQQLASTPLGRLKLQQQQSQHGGGGGGAPQQQQQPFSSYFGSGSAHTSNHCLLPHHRSPLRARTATPVTPTRTAARGARRGGGGSGAVTNFSNATNAIGSGAPSAGFFSNPLPLTDAAARVQQHRSEQMMGGGGFVGGMGMGMGGGAYYGGGAYADPLGSGGGDEASTLGLMDSYYGGGGGGGGERRSSNKNGGGLRSSSGRRGGAANSPLRSGGAGGSGRYGGGYSPSASSSSAAAAAYRRRHDSAAPRLSHHHDEMKGDGGGPNQTVGTSSRHVADLTGGVGAGTRTGGSGGGARSSNANMYAHDADEFLRNLPTARSGAATVRSTAVAGHHHLSSSSSPSVGGGRSSSPPFEGYSFGIYQPPPQPQPIPLQRASSTHSNSSGGRRRSDALLKSQMPMMTRRLML